MSDFEWCTGCKEYDHEKHCCPRWTKVIRNTLHENINTILDEIKAEFKNKADGDDWYHTTDGLIWEEAIEIINKYRVESEGKNENSD